MKLFEALIDTVNALIYAGCFWLILKGTGLETNYIVPASAVLAVFYKVLHDIYTNTKPKP